MMSSEISTRVLPPNRLRRRSGGQKSGSEAAEAQGFQVTHFFVLLSLLAATVAVVMARPNAPENLILISLTVASAGAAAAAFYRMLSPLTQDFVLRMGEPVNERTRLALEREKMLVLR